MGENDKFIFKKCKIKTSFRDATLQCKKLKTVDRIEWDIKKMLLFLYDNKRLIHTTYLNVDYDIKGVVFEQDTVSKNAEFKSEMDKTLQNTKISGLCGVSCLELPDKKVVYLLGEKHIIHKTCSKDFIPLWIYVYKYILSNPKWSYTVDFLLEQDIHEIVKRKSKNEMIQKKLEQLNIKKLRYVVADLCKYSKKGYDSKNPLLKNKINEHVRPQKNDIRGILYNINTVYQSMNQLKKRMTDHNISDDAYMVSKNFVDGLNDFMHIKNIDEFYIKFPWLKELTMRMSSSQKMMYDRMITLEYMIAIENFDRLHNFFEKFESYVETTVMLNDFYTIAYVLLEDVHRTIVYCGLYHTNNIENLLTKYFNFRIVWNDLNTKDIYDENDDECCYTYET